MLYQCRGDILRDLMRSLPDRIGREVSITRRRLDLGVAEQFSDHREALAEGQAPRSEGVAQIVDPHILHRGQLADALPRML